MRKKIARSETFEEETERKLKDEAGARLDKSVRDSLHVKPNKKLRETYNNSETNKILRCVYEVLMSTHKGCSELISIDSGVNRLIFRLCS